MSNLITNPIDVHNALKNKSIEISKNVIHSDDLPQSKVDISWLPKAAEIYNISPNFEDYVLNSVLTFPLNIPNRNNLGFSLRNVSSFSGEHGCCWYKTWIGQPAYQEHENLDYTKANGVIFDTCLHIDKENGFAKVLALVGHDRTKYPALVERVANGSLNSYSMGAYITGGYVCSITGKPLQNSPYQLGNGKQKGSIPNIVKVDGVDRLAFRVGLNPKGFEISLVETPAWSIATSNHIEGQEYL